MTEELSKFIGEEDCSINELPMFKEFINNITNEELGVFKIAVPKDIYLKYFYRHKEAKQFPRFKFVPLKELEDIK